MTVRADRVLIGVLALCLLGVGAPVVAAACNLPGVIPIHALAGHAAGPVRVRGVVSASFPGLDGYFIEAPRGRWDNRDDTSEGIFVYTAHKRSSFTPGHTLIVAARLQSFHGVPELAHPRVLKRCAKQVLPPAVTLDWPTSRSGGWRGLLGMRVRFKSDFVVTGLHDFARYGEIRLAAGARPFAPSAITAPGAGAPALARAQLARSLWLDDGSTATRLRVIGLAGHRFGAAQPLRAGQTLTQLTGIAWHAFGRDLLEPTEFTLRRATNPRRMPLQRGLPEGLRAASFNVENFFNRAFAGPRFPTERGAKNKSAFVCQRAKLVATLAAMRPALAGLQEIENNGYGADGALANLVQALNAALPAARYRYIHPPAPRLGDDLIAPALIYDARVLAPIGKVAVLLPASLPEAAAVGLARPALAARFRPTPSRGQVLRGSDFAFTAVVVHLRSKRSACGGGLDSHAGAGFCAFARAAATTQLDAWIEKNLAAGAVLLFGDFNAYPRERAILNLTQADWSDLAARFVPAESRYTEVYRGRAGELDYAFASPAMTKHIVGAAIWHANADEARALGYDGRMAACGDPATPWRSSDHDPVIVVFRP